MSTSTEIDCVIKGFYCTSNATYFDSCFLLRLLTHTLQQVLQLGFTQLQQKCQAMRDYYTGAGPIIIINPLSILNCGEETFAYFYIYPHWKNKGRQNTSLGKTGTWLSYIDDLVQDCSNSIANPLELPQPCTRPSTYAMIADSLTN